MREVGLTARQRWYNRLVCQVADFNFAKGGKCLMAENILEKADEQVAESIRKLSRATSANGGGD